MSLDIWPHLPPEELQEALQRTQRKELEWQLNELKDTLSSFKQSLEDCYNLLGPSGLGSTLVVTTPRNEIIKGHITRIGTQIVKGTIHLRLRTLHQQTLTVDPKNPITIKPLQVLLTLLTHSLDLLALTLSFSYESNDNDPTSSIHGRADIFIAAQLRVLSQALTDAAELLRGPLVTATDPAWKSCSVSPTHFSPPLLPNISLYVGLQDSQLVLWFRALEPAGVPLNLGMKFALALGTTRRLEHDEADQVFRYCCEDGTAKGLHPPPAANGGPSSSGGSGGDGENPEGPADVYVREKIRVESADPSLMSLSAKLVALNHTLALARRNLAAVMGEELED